MVEMSDEIKRKAAIRLVLIILIISIPFGGGFFLHFYVFSDCQINEECLIDVVEERGIKGLTGGKVIARDLCYYHSKKLYEFKKPRSTQLLGSSVANYLRSCRE